MSKFRKYGPLPDISLSDVLNLSCDNIELLLRYIAGGIRSFNAVWSLYVDSCDRQKLSKVVIRKSVSERIADHIVAHPSKYGEARRWKKTADYSRFIAAISKRLREVQRHWEIHSASLPFYNYSLHFCSANEGRDRWITIVTDALPPGCGIQCNRGDPKEYLLCRQTLEDIQEWKRTVNRKAVSKVEVAPEKDIVDAVESSRLVPSYLTPLLDAPGVYLLHNHPQYQERPVVYTREIGTMGRQIRDSISSRDERRSLYIWLGDRKSGKTTLALEISRIVEEVSAQVFCVIVDCKDFSRSCTRATLWNLLKNIDGKLVFLVLDSFHLLMEEDGLVDFFRRLNKRRVVTLITAGNEYQETFDAISRGNRIGFSLFKHIDIRSNIARSLAKEWCRERKLDYSDRGLIVNCIVANFEKVFHMDLELLVESLDNIETGEIPIWSHVKSIMDSSLVELTLGMTEVPYAGELLLLVARIGQCFDDMYLSLPMLYDDRIVRVGGLELVRDAVKWLKSKDDLESAKNMIRLREGRTFILDEICLQLKDFSSSLQKMIFYPSSDKYSKKYIQDPVLRFLGYMMMSYNGKNALGKLENEFRSILETPVVVTEAGFEFEVTRRAREEEQDELFRQISLIGADYIGNSNPMRKRELLLLAKVEK